MEDAAHPRCPLCGGRAPRYALKKGYAVHRCRGCALLFLHPLPPEEELHSLYDREYFAGAGSGYGYVSYDADKRPMEGAFSACLAVLERLAPGTAEGRRLLDVGTATGFFLRIAQRRGWRVEGVEVSPYAAALARRAGFRVHTGTIGNARFPRSSCSAVTCLDVFEHLRDPIKFLRKARALLTEDGILCIATPDAGSLWARFWGASWNAILPPEHVFLFNRGNLARLLEREGFRVVRAAVIPKRFSLPYVFRVLHRWRGGRRYDALCRLTDTRFFRRMRIPLDVRDNVVVFARKAR